MLSIGWTILAVLLAILLTAWITFTATRLDRLHARVDAAQAALDAQLVRRAAALQHIADCAGGSIDEPTNRQIAQAARFALGPDSAAGHTEHAAVALPAPDNADPKDKEAAENAIGRAVDTVGELALTLPPAAAAGLPELAESSTRVVIARRFYNDAVRDTRTLRGRRMPRLLRLAGHRENPQFFDIDDSTHWN